MITNPLADQTTLPQAGIGLPQLLALQAEREPHRVLFTEWGRDGEIVASLTAAELADRSAVLAGALAAVGRPGDRVLLPAMSGLRFHVAFLACLTAGLVAVPVPPIRVGGLRQSGSGARRLGRLLSICADATPVAAIVPDDQFEALSALAADHEELRRISLLPSSAAGSPLAEPVAMELAAVAFLQYTSGSTSSPKGVMITHGAMLANQDIIARRLHIGPGATVVSWLPLYHDMGLCAGLLQPLYTGAVAVSMEPETFLFRPHRWLEALADRADAVTAAPDFAYRLAAARTPEAVRAGLDLSGWRIALCGAEPVRPDTIRQFAAAFGPSGFRPSALTPAYGLAESTLYVTSSRADEQPVIRAYDRGDLGQGLATPATAEDGVELVSVGRAEGLEVAIVDPQSCSRRAPGRIGEVWIDSPSNGRGYWQRLTESEATFGAELTEEPGRGWLRTGDLGFLDDGELVITGRLKELIIVHGVNYYPQDFERLAQGSSPLLGAGAAAAFVDPRHPEKVVVAVEADRHTPTDVLAGAAEQAARAILVEFPVVLELVILDQSRLPRTTSGKVRRLAAAALYAEGSLAPLTEWPRHV